MDTLAVDRPSPDSTRRRSRWVTSLAGVALGFAYGVVARLVFASSDPTPAWFEIMSLTFIFGVPLSIGVVSVWLAEVRGFGMAVIFPWIPTTLSLLAALALAWEGWICVWLWLPLVLVSSAIGGICAW